MNNCKQFVVCTHTGNSKKYLFYAPTYPDLKICDEVLVDTQFGPQRATVHAVCTIYEDDMDVARVIRVLAGAEDKSVERVIGKYNFVKFDYGEDENNG